LTQSKWIDQYTIPNELDRRLAQPTVSVVVPAFNEEPVIDVTFERLNTVMLRLGLPYELIFVNDGSRDQTLDKLLDLARQHPQMKVINFSRNFGHQIAVTAGIEHAKGAVVVLIDADLQDPPELIEQFIERWKEGYDVVYAVRTRREGETLFKRWSAALFYRFVHGMTVGDIPLNTGDVRLMNRNVVDSLKSIREKHRFIRGLVSWVGFRQIGISYEREERYAGESKYPLKKMLKFATDGIVSFSFKPLQIATKLGLLAATIGFIGILATIYEHFFTMETIVGWSSIMIVVLFLGGVQLLMLGILGEYIGRIYDEVRDRPLYIEDGVYQFVADSTHSRFDEEEEPITK